MKYLLLILLWIFSLLPIQILYLISKIIKFFVYDVLCYREKVVIDNIQNTFIEKSQTEVIKLKNNFYDYFFELIVEIIKLLSISNNELNKRFTFSNINVIKQALKQNKSVIVVVGHYGNWEWALRSASNLIDTKIIGVYKRINNTIFEWLLLKIRSNTNVLPVEIKSLPRELVNNNEKKIYAMVADQSPTCLLYTSPSPRDRG